MADTFRYLDDQNEAVDYQPEPLSGITADKLLIACHMAEDEVDKYFGTKGIVAPIDTESLAATQLDELKYCVAKMAAAVLFSQHNVKGAAAKWRKDAEDKLDGFIAHADLAHASVQSHIGVVNAQEEYVIDWNDPNSTIENLNE